MFSLTVDVSWESAEDETDSDPIVYKWSSHQMVCASGVKSLLQLFEKAGMSGVAKTLAKSMRYNEWKPWFLVHLNRLHRFSEGAEHTYIRLLASHLARRDWWASLQPLIFDGWVHTFRYLPFFERLELPILNYELFMKSDIWLEMDNHWSQKRCLAVGVLPRLPGWWWSCLNCHFKAASEISLRAWQGPYSNLMFRRLWCSGFPAGTWKGAEFTETVSVSFSEKWLRLITTLHRSQRLLRAFNSQNAHERDDGRRTNRQFTASSVLWATRWCGGCAGVAKLIDVSGMLHSKPGLSEVGWGAWRGSKKISEASSWSRGDWPSIPHQALIWGQEIQ